MVAIRVLDLFAGLEGWSGAFRERGHDVISVDIEPKFGTTICQDIMEPLELPWKPTIILASPPCEKFSVMSMGHHWLPGYQPRNDATRFAMGLVTRTVELIRLLDPSFWIIENPMGMLRKMHLIPFERQLVTYCQYGMGYRKATDLWGGFPPSLILEQPCKNGDPCHIAAPRGSKTGVQGDLKLHWSTSEERRNLSAERAKVPFDLSMAVCLAAERDLAAGLRASDYSGTLFA